ncbi:unnamed protein product [Spirodela intermedia]|uniref:Uncharacterized protein n=1 Tax=Spirodela intermedia TaxID=51605 RepID=A0A7I8JSW8_SPIIN|nr:unnamed protein product [Spirodela intermedia]CAA6673219.1 unnamed protein product [Spirodela intermedia]
MKDDDIAPPSSALSPELELFFPSPPRTPPPPLNRHLAAVRMRRGPMYSAYTELRDSRLRRKREEEMLLLSPSSFKLARTRPEPAPEKMKMPAVMRSVPNFSAALRKENRDPGFLSPPPTKVGKFQGTPPRPPPATAAAAPSRAGVLRTAGAGAVASSPSGRNAIKSSGGPRRGGATRASRS